MIDALYSTSSTSYCLAQIIFCSWFSTGGIAVFLTSAGITLLSQLNGIISVTLPFFLEV